MFGYSGHAMEDDEANDNSSCPSTYKHFNAAVKPRSKLGRRRLVALKDEKSQDSDAFHNGEQQLQSQWHQKDDSGICTSGSTPSVTHPVARTGTLFNSQSKFDRNNFISGFMPSLKAGRENKFALPITPIRNFKCEPLKEINGIDNSNKSKNSGVPSTVTSDTSREGGENSLQKQLNSSFICDGSLPTQTHNVSNSQSAGNKTSNETSYSDDSSFMTCHDIQRPEAQTNKTFYDPEFLKTPGKNLAEIRIDESPFNPLEGFLEESDDFRDCEARAPLSNNSCQGKPTQPVRNGSIKISKVCVKSLDSGSQVSDDCQNEQIAFPLAETDVTPMQESRIANGTKNIDHSKPQDFHNRNIVSQVKDSEFMRPGFVLGPQKSTDKVDLNLNSSDVGTMRSKEEKSIGHVVHENCSIDETTNVTYPQHSRGHHPQKNSFTSQFSINSLTRIKPGLQDGGKPLSLSSALGRPLSAASCASNRGVVSATMGAANKQVDETLKNNALHVSSRFSTSKNHPGNVFDNRKGSVDGRGSFGVSGIAGRTNNFVSREPIVQPCISGSAMQSHDADQLDSSTTWIPCVKPPKSQSSHRAPEPEVFKNQSVGSRSFQEDSQKYSSVSLSVEVDTGPLDEVTVMAKGQSRPSPSSKPPAPITPRVDSTSVASQPSNPVQAPLETPQSGNCVMSALIKPQPQNVITIKGTPYTVLSLLGRGGSSQVYQALGPQSSKLMAIKCVNLATVEEAMATDYLNEIGLLSRLQGCPSVIKMIEHEYVEQSRMLYVVLEKGDIDFSKLIKNISETKQISMAMITYYWTEMLSAVHEIHKRGIIHSDLKPANFLLVEGRLKLIDFGIASSLQGDDTTSVMKEVPAGTYNYMSPEAISGRKINRKSDVWSMGCILFNLLYGRTPFSHLNNRWQKLHAIADPNHKVAFPKLQHATPPSLRLALRWCLIKDSASRPTVEELVTLSELAPHVDSSVGKEIDGMMCKYFRKVLPNLKVLSEEEDFI